MPTNWRSIQSHNKKSDSEAGTVETVLLVLLLALTAAGLFQALDLTLEETAFKIAAVLEMDGGSTGTMGPSESTNLIDLAATRGASSGRGDPSGDGNGGSPKKPGPSN